MKSIFDGSIIIATVSVMIFGYNTNYFGYYNCMSQTRPDTITQKGADHVAAQCRTFILEKAFVK